MADRDHTIEGSVVVRPERFVAGGDAIAHDESGRVVFVRGGVPGDLVAVETIERKGAWSRAVATDVVSPSPDRVVPPCEHRRDGCGGCDWQHVDVAAQLPAKLAIVADAFRRTARLPDAQIRVGTAVDPVAYRTTVRVVGDANGRVGFRTERSHDVVPAVECLVAHPALRELMAAISAPAGLEVSLRVSAATGERSARWDRRHGEVDGLPADVRVGQTATIDEVVAGHRFRVSAGSFFQSGPQAAELLVDAVRRAVPEIDEAETVLDAYAGVGLFAVAATPPTAKVITVESSRVAVSDAVVNLADRVATIEFGAFGRWRRPSDQTIDVAIADPSRSGLGRPGTGALMSAAAPVIALVSCDPVAAARDAALLSSHGYRHDGTEVLDLFPHTHHVECVTRFVRVG